MSENYKLTIMKELSIEEKAKRYDEALKVLHKYDGANIMFSQSLKEEMFPELREESEDEKHRKFILEYLYDGLRKSDEQFKGQFKCAIAWLEKQGKKPAWSEEDDTFFKAIIRDIENTQYISEDAKKDRINWLKSLKDRVQPKQEWSIEDEAFYQRLEQIVCKVNIEAFQGDRDLHSWLKSLRPQNRWKPSEEQMHYLSWIANVKLGDSVVEQEVSKHLNELLEDLKKLRGEQHGI